MSQDQSPPLEIKFQQYLYFTKVYVHYLAPAEQTLNTILNELGPQGWELEPSPQGVKSYHQS